MIFQRKVWAITTSKIERLCVDEQRIIIQEMDLIQQYYGGGRGPSCVCVFSMPTNFSLIWLEGFLVGRVRYH